MHMTDSKSVVRMVMALVVLCSIIAAALAYLPEQWNESDGSDFAKSEAVVIGRVTEIRRVTHEKEVEIDGRPIKLYKFSYIASLTVGRVLRGSLKTNDLVNLWLGVYEQTGSVDETAPTLLRHSTIYSQAAFDLAHNGVYLVALVRDLADHPAPGMYWKPRRGHWSIHKVEERWKWHEQTIVSHGVRHGTGWKERQLIVLAPLASENNRELALDAFLEKYMTPSNGPIKALSSPTPQTRTVNE